MSKTLKIGDQSRDGSLVIADTSWDHNGTLRVNVRTVANSVWPLDISKARRLARRALEYPETIKSSRVIKQYRCEDGCDHVTFAVSRLEA